MVPLLSPLLFSLLTTVTMDLRRGRYPTSGRICKPPSLRQHHPYCVAARARINAWMLSCLRVVSHKLANVPPSLRAPPGPNCIRVRNHQVNPARAAPSLEGGYGP